LKTLILLLPLMLRPTTDPLRGDDSMLLSLVLTLRGSARSGVPLDSHRTWNSGRRPVRVDILARAQAARKAVA